MDIPYTVIALVRTEHGLNLGQWFYETSSEDTLYIRHRDTKLTVHVMEDALPTEDDPREWSLSDPIVGPLDCRTASQSPLAESTLKQLVEQNSKINFAC